MIKQYKKKPVIIEAIQYINNPENEIDNLKELRNFVGNTLYTEYKRVNLNNNKYEKYERKIKIKTLEGDMIISNGDYIIKGIHGEFYPCKEDIFNSTYELVE